jgi:hexokinase
VKSNCTGTRPSLYGNRSIKSQRSSRLVKLAPCLVRTRLVSQLSRFLYKTDYLADSVDAFLTSSDSAAALPSSKELPLGLTFSFPVEQTALDQGYLLTWTKGTHIYSSSRTVSQIMLCVTGFSAKNAKGNDVVKLLQDAFNRKHLHVKCVALVNDVRACPFLYP